ncbi:MAG: pilus assembly protein [Lachnospiraceae bacterium]|nr:pilus assembly protein [Lachnospiraceae bacterium]
MERYKGSQTVEMAIIFPTIFLTVAVIVLWGLYIHDATKMQAGAYSRAVSLSYNEDRAKGETQNVITFLYKNKTEKIEKKGNTKVQYIGSLKKHLMMFGGMVENGSIIQTAEAESRFKIEYLYIGRLICGG